MNASKRLCTIPKNNVGEGKHYGKQKDIHCSPRLKSEGKLIETDLTNIPIIKQSDNARLLPKFTSKRIFLCAIHFFIVQFSFSKIRRRCSFYG